jgi:hypothetical protein
MTYTPNVPEMLVTDQLDVPNIRDVFLVEFSDTAPIREVLMDPTSAEPPETEDVPEAAVEEAVDEKPMTTEELMAQESFATRPVASASGLRIHRVIAPDHSVVTQFDAELDRTPLDFLGDKGAVVASARPGDPYTWQLIGLGGLSPDGNVAPITGTRPATADEAAALDEMYPGWLAACAKFDAERAAEIAAEAINAAAMPSLPPPSIPAA